MDFSNPQSFNRYAYVANNPLGNIDRLGLAITGPLLSFYVRNGYINMGCTQDGLSSDCASNLSLVSSGSAALLKLACL